MNTIKLVMVVVVVMVAVVVMIGDLTAAVAVVVGGMGSRRTVGSFSVDYIRRK